MKHAFRCAIFLLAPACLHGQTDVFLPASVQFSRANQWELADQLDSLSKQGLSSAQMNKQGHAILGKTYSLFREGSYARHFPNGYGGLDLSRDEFRRVARNFVLSNSRNRRGYNQELKYLNLLSQPDSPFEVLDVGDRAPTSSGRVVEFDARLREKRTGLFAASEFKNWKISSQSQVDAAKDQMNKIAIRAREEKVPRAIWINRQKVPEHFRSDLERYAAKRNIGFYDDISTGSSKKSTSLTEVLEEESDSLKEYRWMKATGRVIGITATAYGAGKVVYSGHLWQHGGMTTRTATVTASEGVGAAVGGASGAYLGAQLGSFGGPFAWATIPAGGVLGGLAGAITGSWGGKAAGETLVDEVIFKDLEHNETTAVIAYLQQQY